MRILIIETDNEMDVLVSTVLVGEDHPITKLDPFVDLVEDHEAWEVIDQAKENHLISDGVFDRYIVAVDY